MGRGEASKTDGVELKRIAEKCARAEGVGLAEGKARAAKRSQEPARSGASQFSWLTHSQLLNPPLYRYALHLNRVTS